MYPTPDICYTCKHIKPDCKDCLYNKNIESSTEYIAGPCGEKLCWYGCDRCRKNNYFNYVSEEGKKIFVVD